MCIIITGRKILGSFGIRKRSCTIILQPINQFSKSKLTAGVEPDALGGNLWDFLRLNIRIEHHLILQKQEDIYE